MPISISLSGQPVCRSKMLLTDVETAKKIELDRRKKLRLLQVRQQAKDMANEVRTKVRMEKDKQKNVNEQQKLNFAKRWEAKKVDDLQHRYKECLKDVGQAHTQAAMQPDLNDFLRKEKEINRLLAVTRGACATDKLHKDQKQNNAKEMAGLKRKQLVREKEDFRSNLVASLPPPPVSSLPSKCDNGASAGTSSRCRSSVPVSSSRRCSPNKIKRLNGKCKVKKPPFMLVDDIPSNLPSSRPTGRINKQPTTISANCTDRRSGEVSIMITARGQNCQSSKQNKSPVRVRNESDPYDTLEKENVNVIGADHQTGSSNTDVDNLPSSKCTCTTVVDRSCNCPCKREVNQPPATTTSSSTQKRSPDRRRRYSVGCSDEEESFDSDVTWPPCTPRSYNSKTDNTPPLMSARVDYYDHNNRFHATSQPSTCVTRLDQLHSSRASARVEQRRAEEKVSKMQLLNDNQSKRCDKALERQRCRNDFQQLIKELKQLDKKERQLRCSTLRPSQNTVTNERQRKERLVNHQRKMEDAIHRVVPNTGLQDIHSKKDAYADDCGNNGATSSTTNETPKLNVAQWNSAPENGYKVGEDGGGTERRPRAGGGAESLPKSKLNLESLMQRINEQREMLFKEIKSDEYHDNCRDKQSSNNENKRNTHRTKQPPKNIQRRQNSSRCKNCSSFFDNGTSSEGNNNYRQEKRKSSGESFFVPWSEQLTEDPKNNCTVCNSRLNRKKNSIMENKRKILHTENDNRNMPLSSSNGFDDHCDVEEIPRWVKCSDETDSFDDQNPCDKELAAINPDDRSWRECEDDGTASKQQTVGTDCELENDNHESEVVCYDYVDDLNRHLKRFSSKKQQVASFYEVENECDVKENVKDTARESHVKETTRESRDNDFMGRTKDFKFPSPIPKRNVKNIRSASQQPEEEHQESVNKRDSPSKNGKELRKQTTDKSDSSENSNATLYSLDMALSQVSMDSSHDTSISSFKGVRIVVKVSGQKQKDIDKKKTKKPKENHQKKDSLHQEIPVDPNRKSDTGDKKNENIIKEEDDGMKHKRKPDQSVGSSSTSYQSPPDHLTPKQIDRLTDLLSKIENRKDNGVSMLKTYISKLLSMSRDSIDKLNVSSSDVSIHSSIFENEQHQNNNLAIKTDNGKFTNVQENDDVVNIDDNLNRLKQQFELFKKLNQYLENKQKNEKNSKEVNDMVNKYTEIAKTYINRISSLAEMIGGECDSVEAIRQSVTLPDNTCNETSYMSLPPETAINIPIGHLEPCEQISSTFHTSSDNTHQQSWHNKLCSDNINDNMDNDCMEIFNTFPGVSTRLSPSPPSPPPDHQRYQPSSTTSHQSQSKPPPTLLNGGHRLCTPHELSMIQEVDTPSTSRQQSRQNQSLNQSKMVSPKRHDRHTLEKDCIPDLSLSDEKIEDINLSFLTLNSQDDNDVDDNDNFSELLECSTSSSSCCDKLHSGESLPDIMEELLRRGILTSPFPWAKKKNKQQKSSVTEDISSSQMADEEVRGILKESSPEDIECLLEELGLGWASTTLRKTRQAGELKSEDSSSSSLVGGPITDMEHHNYSANKSRVCRTGRVTSTPDSAVNHGSHMGPSEPELSTVRLSSNSDIAYSLSPPDIQLLKHSFCFKTMSDESVGSLS